MSTPRQPAKKTANKAVKSRPAPPASSRPKKRKRHWLRGLIIIFVVLAALGVERATRLKKKQELKDVAIEVEPQGNLLRIKGLASA